MKVEQLSKMTIAFKVCWYTLQNTSLYFKNTGISVEVGSAHI